MANAYNKYGVEDPNKVKQRYSGYYTNYANQANAQAQQQIKARQAAAEKQQNQNYINYMMAQKAMPEQMARLGLTGGATESALLRQNLNYANTRYNTNAAAQSDIGTINQNLTNNLNAYRLDNQKAMQTELSNNENALYERKTAAKQQAYENNLRNKQFKLDEKKYKATRSDNSYTKLVDRIGQYGTVKDVNKQIKGINKKIKTLNSKLKKTKSKTAKAKIRDQIRSQKTEKALFVARRSALKGVIEAEKRAKK